MKPFHSDGQYCNSSFGCPLTVESRILYLALISLLLGIISGGAQAVFKAFPRHNTGDGEFYLT